MYSALLSLRQIHHKPINMFNVFTTMLGNQRLYNIFIMAYKEITKNYLFLTVLIISVKSYHYRKTV